MTEITWNDEPGSRGRKAWLLLVSKGEVTAFCGESIPAIVAVVGVDYHRNGKWSNSTYRLRIGDGVRAIPGRDGWDLGTFAEGLAAAGHGPCDTWGDVANALGVSVQSARRFLTAWRPKAAERLDAVDAAIAAVDEAAGDAGAEEIAISFGAPTRRMREAGFWAWPVTVALPSGEVVALDPSGDYESPDGRVKVLAVERTGGHGGGYVSLRIAAPVGATATHGDRLA